MVEWLINEVHENAILWDASDEEYKDWLLKDSI